jgi:O-antigen ligase
VVLDRFIRVNFMVAIGAIGFGVVVYLAALVGLSGVLAPIGFSESVGYGAHGTMREPNIFGSYAALFFVLGLTTVVGRSSLLNLKLTSWLRLVSGIGLVLSFTRAAWIGALAVVLPTLFELRRRVRWRRIVALVGSAILAISIAASPLVPQNYLRFKVLNLVNFSTSSAAGRLAIWDKAITEYAERPWFGWGAYSYGDKNAELGTPRALRPWIGNFVITALHDSGLVGTSLLFLFLGINLIGGLRASRQLRGIDSTSSVRLVGLVYGVVAVLIAFLATTGFSYAYPWIALGLIGAYRRRVRELAAQRRRLTVGGTLALEPSPLTV